MNDAILPILKNPALAERVSSATRRVLEQRVEAASAPQFLPLELYVVLQQVVDVLLPQESVGTHVDVAAAIDRRLAQGKSAGWRFADLPADGEAYRCGLEALAHLSKQTSEDMPLATRENYLLGVARGDFDDAAGFALSRWFLMLKTDVVRAWLAHPAVMQEMQFFGFADGATGVTDGPTDHEGWKELGPNHAMPFERQGGSTEQGA